MNSRPGAQQRLNEFLRSELSFIENCPGNLSLRLLRGIESPTHFSIEGRLQVSAMIEAFVGGCTCRRVRYQMTSRPLFVHCCHCRWCQRESGASFALNALIESDRVRLLHGEVRIIDTPSASGKGQRIARCAQCHVAVWSHYAGAGDAVSFIRVGTLDEPDRFPPDVHIFAASKQPWVVLPAGAPVVPEYYKSSELWPPESLARRAALLGEARR
jgi:hypothetical protein